MKVLIAYDGSECSDAALRDLSRAGLPAQGQALVVCVADAVAQLAGAPSAALAGGPWCYLPGIQAEHELANRDLDHAKTLAAQAAASLQAKLPDWSVETEVRAGLARSVLSQKAQEWRPDLLVVGSCGPMSFKHFLTGSVSKAIGRHVKCSLRIGRHPQHPDRQPIRLLVGVDGSENAAAAVEAVAARNWPAGTSARVIGVIDSGVALTPASLVEDQPAAAEYRELRSAISLALRHSAQRLEKSGLSAAPQVRVGIPENVFVDEAQAWNADCIFLGASEAGRLERFFMGSTSAAVVANAPCSIELVRCRH
jgi:nucleotide-binding universal stress UspA family protein